MLVRKLKVSEIPKLTELFKYKDVNEMIVENTKEMENGVIDIFALFDGDKIIGELRAKYISDDKRFAEKINEHIFMLSAFIRNIKEKVLAISCLKMCWKVLKKTVIANLPLVLKMTT